MNNYNLILLIGKRIGPSNWFAAFSSFLNFFSLNLSNLFHVLSIFDCSRTLVTLRLGFWPLPCYIDFLHTWRNLGQLSARLNFLSRFVSPFWWKFSQFFLRRNSLFWLVTYATRIFLMLFTVKALQFHDIFFRFFNSPFRRSKFI